MPEDKWVMVLFLWNILLLKVEEALVVLSITQLDLWLLLILSLIQLQSECLKLTLPKLQ